MIGLWQRANPTLLVPAFMRILTSHPHIPLIVSRHQAASSMSKPRTRKYADKAGSSSISSRGQWNVVFFPFVGHQECYALFIMLSSCCNYHDHMLHHHAMIMHVSSCFHIFLGGNLPPRDPTPSSSGVTSPEPS
jgi:hypothetical protein